jgi:hypothetical protein
MTLTQTDSGRNSLFPVGGGGGGGTKPPKFPTKLSNLGWGAAGPHQDFRHCKLKMLRYVTIRLKCLYVFVYFVLLCFNRSACSRIDKGPVIKYLLGGVEDILGGTKKKRTSEGGTKKTTEPLGGYQNLSTIGTQNITFYNYC